jgi:hypothetical protein
LLGYQRKNKMQQKREQKENNYALIVELGIEKNNRIIIKVPFSIIILALAYMIRYLMIV